MSSSQQPTFPSVPCVKRTSKSMKTATSLITGWWFEPLWKIWTSVGMIIPNIWENKKIATKPPTRYADVIKATSSWFPTIAQPSHAQTRAYKAAHSCSIRSSKLGAVLDHWDKNWIRAVDFNLTSEAAKLMLFAGWVNVQHFEFPGKALGWNILIPQRFLQ